MNVFSSDSTDLFYVASSHVQRSWILQPSFNGIRATPACLALHVERSTRFTIKTHLIFNELRCKTKENHILQMIIRKEKTNVFLIHDSEVIHQQKQF